MARDRSPAREGRSRPLKVGEEIRHLLGELLARGELRDPALAGLSITVTEVRMTPDLRRAVAYVLPFAGGAADQAVAGLARAAPHLRREIGRRIRLRYVPELTFEADTTFDRAERMDRLLRDLAPEDDGGSAA